MKRHQGIEDQALDWVIRRDESAWTQAEQAELDAWLAQSMAHKAAFWRCEHGWEEASRIRSLGVFVEPVDAPGLHRPRWWPAAIAAGVAAIVGLGWRVTNGDLAGAQQSPAEQVRYETAVGARQVIPLADGSKVELNTRTAMRTMVTRTSRKVWLDSGEAYFEVAHRDGEPFVVHAGKQKVTVLGTKFSVRRDKDRVTVNVLEGRVRVDDDVGVGARAAIITAGDTAISRGPSTLIAANSRERVENALAWRDGMLTFDQVRLSDVAAEFNRYNRTQLTISDPAIADIPIGGAFQASNVDAFVRLLRDAYGLTTEETAGRIQISK